MVVFFFKQKTAYEMRISDWSSDVCASDLGVDLEEVIIGASADFAPARRHDAACHCAAETEGIAHREHPVADAQLVAVAESYVRHWLCRLDLDEGKIGLLVAANERRLQFRSVILHDGNILTTLHDVIVCDGIAVGGDEEARALR